jgi:hypothetical protein
VSIVTRIGRGIPVPGPLRCAHEDSPCDRLDTLAGTIQQGGGLKYTGKDKTAELTAILIDTSAKQLSADIGSGGDVPVMDLQLGPLNQTGGMIQADVTLTLTSDGEQALGIDGLKSGMTMGTGVIQAKAD